jgi:hypothetical protein
MIYKLRLIVLILLFLLALPLVAEEVRPDTGANAVTVTNNDCSVSTAHGILDDDPQSPGSDWCNATTNADTLIHVRFTSPSGNISTGTDAQTFRVYVRKDLATTPGSGTPTLALDAYDNGVLEDADEAAGTITAESDSGELYTETWTSTTSDGSNIEVYMFCTAAGGGPNKRACDFESVEWDVTLATGERTMVIGRIVRDEEETVSVGR